MAVKGRQISVRVMGETDAWLERRAGGRSKKAEFIRRLIEREMAREKEANLLDMFNKAAAEVREEDRTEREALLGAFIATEEPAEAETKARAKGKGPR